MNVNKTFWDRLLNIVIIAIGFVPYIGATYLTIFGWIKFEHLSRNSSLAFNSIGNDLLLGLAIIGSWIIWYGLCKIVSIIFYWGLSL